MKLYFSKRPGCLVPENKESEDYLSSLKLGDAVLLGVTRPRNYDYLKKYFALLNFAYEHAEFADVEYKGQKVEPNFNEFRANLSILAGFYTPVYDLQGAVHLRAKSVSFAQMDSEEFERLYDKTITVIMRKVLVNYSRTEIDEVVNRLLEFT